MRYNSKAIALGYSKYGESSIIAKVLTKEKGLQSFIVKGIRGRKSKKKLVFFEPLQLLNITASYIPKRNLQYISEVGFFDSKINQKINIKKNLICIFIAELTSKILESSQGDKFLFEFIWQTKRKLIKDSLFDVNFPIIFMIKLSEIMGFYPLYSEEKNTFFNLETGEFTNYYEQTNQFMNKENSFFLSALLKQEKIVIPQTNRKQLIIDLINYYKLQHHELKNITSHIIIESLRV